MLGLCDIDTFKTTQYFHQDKYLIDDFNNYIINNKDSTFKIKVPVSILALYQQTDEKSIYHDIYIEELNNIIYQYNKLNQIIIEQNHVLDTWIRENINNFTNEIIKATEKDISNIIYININNIVSIELYNRFVEFGILDAADIRMIGSTANELEVINSEYVKKIQSLVLDYIEEAKSLKKEYDIAFSLYAKEATLKINEINRLSDEYNSLGILSHHRKRELSNIISQKKEELYNYKQNHEPKELLKRFENMYRR